MWQNADHLKEMLKKLELFKQEIMKEINRLDKNDEAIVRTTVYPMAKVKPLEINGYPVFQFGYEGMLPLYKEDDYEYLSMIRHYYFRATFDAYDYSKLKLPAMEKAVIIFVHYFKDDSIRDLDNRNKKYIQDAIRQTRIINSDSWQHVWNMDMAYKDKEKSHVQVYVVPQHHFTDFIQFLMDNHDTLKNGTKYLMKRSEYEAEYMKEKSLKENSKYTAISDKTIW